MGFEMHLLPHSTIYVINPKNNSGQKETVQTVAKDKATCNTSQPLYAIAFIFNTFICFSSAFKVVFHWGELYFPNAGYILSLYHKELSQGHPFYTSSVHAVCFQTCQVHPFSTS